MSNDSHHFRTAETLNSSGHWLEGNRFRGSHDLYLPLYEAKMIHQFDHRWATYDQSLESRFATFEEKCNPAFSPQPRFWVLDKVVEAAVPAEASEWFLGWRDICRANDERTLIASAVPRVAVGNKIPLFGSTAQPALQASLLGVLNSFACDFCARQKVGGTTFNYFIIKQVAVASPDTFLGSLAWIDSENLCSWFRSRVIELVYTAHDLASLARDFGYVGQPFPWNIERRFQLRSELDAAIFHLYLPAKGNGDWRLVSTETQEQLAELRDHFPVPRDAVAYILDQFPLVRQKDEKAHGHYRTKDRILEIYDAMLEAQKTGRPYQTTLNPPPGVQ